MSKIIISTEQNPTGVGFHFPDFPDRAAHIIVVDVDYILPEWEVISSPGTDPEDVAGFLSHPGSPQLMKGDITLSINGGTSSITKFVRLYQQIPPM